MIMMSSATQNPTGTSGVPGVSNYVLLPQEAAFLAFSGKMIRSNLENKVDTIFLSSAALMQTNFTEWTQAHIANMTFTPDQLNLGIIVVSIWNKTKAYVESLLNVSNNAQAIEDEKLAQFKADKIAEDLIRQGYEGKTFTLRQATVLLETAKIVGM